jgi:hypothetical protein
VVVNFGNIQDDILYGGESLHVGAHLGGGVALCTGEAVMKALLFGIKTLDWTKALTLILVHGVIKCLGSCFKLLLGLG